MTSIPIRKARCYLYVPSPTIVTAHLSYDYRFSQNIYKIFEVLSSHNIHIKAYCIL